MFQVSYNKDWHVFEIINFLILGVLGVSKKKFTYLFQSKIFIKLLNFFRDCLVRRYVN
jgi:hypothetical protein